MLKATAVIRDDIKASAKVDGKIEARVRFPSVVMNPRRGILYARNHLHYGRTVSYLPYDETWRIQEGEFNFPQPENPKYIQQLDMDAALPYYKLKYENKYGTYDRFTAYGGGQDYTEHPNLLECHLIGCIFYAAPAGIPPMDHLVEAYNLNVNGVVGWRLTTLAEVSKLQIDYLSITPQPQRDFFGQTRIARVATGTRLSAGNNFIAYRANEGTSFQSSEYGSISYGGIYIKYFDNEI